MHAAASTLILLVTVAASQPTDPKTLPIVTTPYGQVQGVKEVSPTGKTVDAYLGIPFAGPPLGEFRFKPPPPLKPWDGVLNATAQPLTCYQKKQPLAEVLPALKHLRLHTKLSEDCLYLNVWVPKSGKPPPSGFPVMVYIFGGGFSRGAISYSSLISSVLPTEENVILVAPSYRVGALGFAFLNNSDVPGNAGLYDQLAALKWIRESIASFGGDPEKVTIFGQSAGASSVGHLLLSPLTSGLFQRGIMQSGAATAYFAYQEPDTMYHNTTQLIDNLGCDKTNMTAVVKCLQNADPLDIVQSEPQGDYDMVYTFQPTIDGQLIARNPLETLKDGSFEKREILVGTNKDEATIFLPAIRPFLFRFQDNIRVSADDMKELLEIVSPFSPSNEVVISLMYEAGVDKNDTSTVINAGSAILTDFVFTCPVMDTAKYNSEIKNRVYVYYLPYRSSVTQTPLWMGTVHGEDLKYVFGAPLFPAEGYNPNEIAFSKRVMRYWANFARTGDPNKGPSGKEPVVWPRYTKESRNYLVLAPKSRKVGKDLKMKKCAFWGNYRHLLDKIDHERQGRSRCSQ